MKQSRHRWFTSALLAAIATIALTATAALAAGNGKLQIHHMKIGQGDGTLLISPNGQTALFDDGVYTNCTYIKSYVQGLGIASVDYHFLSHYHADHLGCIDDLAAVGITVLTAGYDRGNSYSSATYTAYTTTLGAKRTTIAKGQTITLDAGSANPVTVTCVDLNGAGVYSVSGSDENAKSAVYKVSYGGFDEIVGGDLTGSTANGNDVETTIGPEVGDVEVYKVHHHGSAYSSNDNWLNAISAEVGIIMCGDGNSYGHPTAAALTRLHNHGVKTYWTETGAGATPDANWDKVANGTVLVEVNLAANNYTVTAGASTDTYTIPTGGPPPTLNATQVASAVVMTQGTITAGSVASLATSDNTRMTVTAAKTGTNYWTDWYGEVVLAHPPVSLTVTYEGSFSVSRTQTLHVWNWSTSAWNQVNSATVSTTDAVKTWTTPTPANYVSPAGVVRVRVLGNNRTSSYTCRGDQMKFDYTYQQGTITTRTPEEFARLVPPTYHEPYRNLTPQASVRTLTASALGRRVALAWSTGAHDHMDGFNIYRENAEGERVHVGGEAVMATTAEEITFGYTDETAPEGESVYWLGARSCAGPEGMIGPIRVTRASAGPALETFAFAASPNPAVRNVRFALTLPAAGAAELAIFDLSGRRVATPLKGSVDAGVTHVDWALQRDDGGRVQPGVYFARIEALGRAQVARVTVLQP